MACGVLYPFGDLHIHQHFNQRTTVHFFHYHLETISSKMKFISFLSKYIRLASMKRKLYQLTLQLHFAQQQHTAGNWRCECTLHDLMLSITIAR